MKEIAKELSVDGLSSSHDLRRMYANYSYAMLADKVGNVDKCCTNLQEKFLQRKHEQYQSTMMIGINTLVRKMNNKSKSTDLNTYHIKMP